MASIWKELKRRKVVWVAVTYAVVGWLAGCWSNSSMNRKRTGDNASLLIDSPPVRQSAGFDVAIVAEVLDLRRVHHVAAFVATVKGDGICRTILPSQSRVFPIEREAFFNFQFA